MDRMPHLASWVLVVSIAAGCSESASAQPARCQEALEAATPFLDDVRVNCAPVFRHKDAKGVWENLTSISPSERYAFLTLGLAEVYCPRIDGPKPPFCSVRSFEQLPASRPELDAQWALVLRKILEREVPKGAVQGMVEAFQRGTSGLFPAEDSSLDPHLAYDRAETFRKAVKPREPTVEGSIDPKEIHESSFGGRGELAACRTRSWPKETSATLSLRYTLSGQGEVVSVSVLAPKDLNRDVRQCLERVVSAWWFPRSPGDGTAVVEQTFEVSPR